MFWSMARGTAPGAGRGYCPCCAQAGHVAHAVTLTGVGERAHLLSAAVDIDTHIQDIIGLIDAEELRNVILVGHSYAGNLITCVADRLQQRSPGLLKALVYVDASVPSPGDSWSTPHTPETVQKRIAEAQASGGLSFPPPDASVFGLTGADRDWVNRRRRPSPSSSTSKPCISTPIASPRCHAPSSTAPIRPLGTIDARAKRCAASRAGRWWR